MEMEQRQPEGFESEEALDCSCPRRPTSGVQLIRETGRGYHQSSESPGRWDPTLAMLARPAADAAGARKRIIGVARFSSPDVKEP